MKPVAATPTASSFSPPTISGRDDESARVRADNVRVSVNGSYGVVWQENDHAPLAGKLELGANELRLEARDCDHVAVCAFPYRDLVAVHVGRENCDRLDGRLTLLLERSNGDSVRIAALTQAGIVTEIAEQLAAHP